MGKTKGVIFDVPASVGCLGRSEFARAFEPSGCGDGDDREGKTYRDLDEVKKDL